MRVVTTACPRARRLMRTPRSLLLTILVLNNVVNVAYFAIASAWATSCTDNQSAVLVSLGALIALILCGEIILKVLASRAPVASC